MKQALVLSAILFSSLFTFAQNAIPSVSNVSVSFDDASKKITVTFDLADSESDDIEVGIALSDNYGETFFAEVLNVQGDAGYPVAPGSGKQITFNYNDSLQPVPGWAVRVTADDRQPFDIQQLVNQVDSNRLRNTLAFIEGIRHYQTGISHLEEVKDYIESNFRQRELFTYRQNFPHNGYSAANIIGSLPGLKNESILYIVDAHFDSVNNSPGADDNGSGMAGALEAARILSQYRFEHTIKFIGFDFEESSPSFGLTGSRKYVAEGIKSHEQLEGVFNFEMIGYYSEKPNSQTMPPLFDLYFQQQYDQLEADSFRGNFLTNVADTPSANLGIAFADAAAQYVPGLKVVSLVSPDDLFIKPNLMRSDHASFWLGGYEALMLTDGGNFRNPLYHTPNDTIGSLNFSFMSKIVKAAIAAAATVAKPLHASSKIAHLFSTGIEGTRHGCDWKMIQSKNGIKLFPDANCNLRDWIIRLSDSQGKLVFSRAYLNEDLTIETSFLPAGMYFLTAFSGEIKASLKVVIR